MHHVTGARNAVKPALRNVGVEPGRLLTDVDQPILLAGMMTTGIFKLAYSF
jgi:hypothetical protein